MASANHLEQEGQDWEEKRERTQPPSPKVHPSPSLFLRELTPGPE